MQSSKMSGREIQIPSRVGYIAGLEWGNSNGTPVLAVHGLMDNALSFLPLIQLLPSHLHIIAIDLYGHGRSPHLPKGHPYDVFQFIYCILEVANWLKWDKFSIIGHSLGAISAIKFTAIFPNRVENLITLDVLFPDVNSTLMNKLSLAEGVALYLKLESREFDFSGQPALTWDQIIERFSSQRKNVSRKNVELLLQRNTRVSKTKEGLYEFTRDHRVNMGNYFMFSRLEGANIMKELSNYHGTWLAIIDKEDMLPGGNKRAPFTITKEHIGNCKFFEVIEVNTKTHHFHMEYPELVARYIEKVFDKQSQSKL